MPKPPWGPQTPTHPPPSTLNCCLWSVVSAESICFFGILQGLNYVLPPTRFKPAVRFVTKFTSEIFNSRVEKFFRGCCNYCGVRPRLRCSSLPLRPKYVQKSWCYTYPEQIGDGYLETPTSRLATLTASSFFFSLFYCIFFLFSWWAQFFSWNQKINLLYLLSFSNCIFFLSRSLGFTCSLSRSLVLLVP